MNIGNIWEIVISVSLSVFGGLAKLLQIKDRSAFNKVTVFAELVASAFIGLIVLFVGRAMNLHGDWLGAVCGISGFIGIRVLDMLSKPLMNSIGVELKDKNEEAELDKGDSKDG